MRWGNIKTLFIICFLILDVYLVLEMMEKRETDNLSALEDTSREETLRANYEGLEALEEMSEEEMTASYLFLKPRIFNDEDLEELESDGNQSYTTVNEGTMLLSKFDEPIAFPEESSNDEMATIVKEVAALADNYTFWAHEENTNTMIFFQENEDQPIYYSQSGVLLVFLNEENEIERYIQTEMEEDREQEPRDLITPIDAVAYLDYNADDLLFGDNITDAELGHHTLTSLQDSQVYVPSWRIEVNENRNYLVNAVEGGYQQLDNMSFLRELLTSFRERITVTEETNEIAEETEARMETILETTTWSEENDD